MDSTALSSVSSPVPFSLWQECRRPSDGERVGYLAPAGQQAIPMTLLGTPLGEAQAPDTAAALLHERGLAVLNGRWWCLLPPVLTAQTDPAAPAADWEWRAVVVVEVSPHLSRIRPEWPVPEEASQTVTLSIPVGDMLQERQP